MFPFWGRHQPIERITMRVTMRGEITLEQLQAQLSYVCTELKLSGVERLRGINLYFTPLGPAGELAICTPDGSPVEIISINPQRSRITFLRKQGEFSSDGPDDANGRLAAKAVPDVDE